MKACPSIFGFDPKIGCPFDEGEMMAVAEWRGFKVGMQVDFRSSSSELLRGPIVAIGENAKYLNGDSFVAFAIKVDEEIHFTTHKEVHHVV